MGTVFTHSPSSNSIIHQGNNNYHHHHHQHQINNNNKNNNNNNNIINSTEDDRNYVITQSKPVVPVSPIITRNNPIASVLTYDRSTHIVAVLNDSLKYNRFTSLLLLTSL